MSKYLDGIYFNAKPIIAKHLPFVIIMGGRGIGKTYTTLRTMIEESYRFIYLRRSKTEIEISCNKSGNPFKKLNIDYNWNIEVLPGKITTIINLDDKRTVGYASALSTFANMRGVDFSDVEYIVFDEFQQLGGSGRIKEEYQALMHLYETVNRNRELEGRKPVMLILLSNAVSIASPILLGFGVSDIISKMIAQGQESLTLPDKGIFIHLPADVPVSDMKLNTVLYNVADSSFKEHSISNRFTNDDITVVKVVQLNEYTPVVSFTDNIGSMYMYRHKDRAEYHITTSKAACENLNSITQSKMLLMRYKNFWIYQSELGVITYSKYSLYQRLYKIFMGA